jgi:hypothetical protein
VIGRLAPGDDPAVNPLRSFMTGWHDGLMADADAIGDDHTTFIEIEGMATLSRAAVVMHTAGIVNSIRDGRPGFVSDDYLNAISAETTTTVLELEAAGLWERRDGGYLIVEDEMLKVALDFHDRTDRLEAECAQRGAHVASSSDDESGWVICCHCTIPLERPDGGPVALPEGGPLGPDPRQ